MGKFPRSARLLDLREALDPGREVDHAAVNAEVLAEATHAGADHDDVGRPLVSVVDNPESVSFYGE